MPDCGRNLYGGGVMTADQRVPSGRELLSGNVAAAYAVLLARARVVAAYPITPQTILVEKLAEYAPQYGIEYITVESEHSMVAAVRGSTKAGVRSFCATSSHGLAYAHEQLQTASRERIPLVMVNVNRSFANPWHLQADLQDSMSQRDTGWIQLYCSSPQEILDTIFCAFKLAENLMLPVMVCYEGFTMSHLGAPVVIPDQETVDRFLPAFNPPKKWLLSADNPVTHGASAEPEIYSKHQRQIHEAMLNGEKAFEEIAAEFTQVFGREKVGALEITGSSEASLALVTCGATGETAKTALETDKNFLLARLHMFRPFPKKALLQALRTMQKIAIIDRAISFGSGGPIAIELKDVFYNMPLVAAPNILSLIGGLGGTDITPNTIKWAVNHARAQQPVWIKNLYPQLPDTTIIIPEEVK
ncbi:MAG: Pyruvate ferredoxin oxidoreductase, alpha subunit [Parcubacteria group bacterium GW2011_GWA2_47_9]|nr:MAG: Pyruvate ferredoxin oxidoreductase, alpha subunit [Parcubacteria group bacterium GW2011_GWA2_47_9]